LRSQKDILIGMYYYTKTMSDVCISTNHFRYNTKTGEYTRFMANMKKFYEIGIIRNKISWGKSYE